jgi:hypothetical protein
MTVRDALTRLRAMDREELRVRAAVAARGAADRVRFAVARPGWRRSNLASALNPDAAPGIREAATAMSRGDAMTAHRALAAHFETRLRRWPLSASNRTPLTAAIRERFPTASMDARNRAERIVAGRFDLLGYHDLALGNPPDWHADVVHERRAPRRFWASVPYLDPASGDHKVIWEANRHQHFLTLGEAFWLTGDRRYRDTFVAHLEDWLRANPPLDGVNWASMLELAFRTLSWTWAVEYFCTGSDADRTPWLVDLLVALDRQLTHIEQNLSTYFSPNTHLSGEALALYAVSVAFPELRRSAGRAGRARTILLHEGRAQVRPDGGHAELSTHYHRYSTDFYLLALLVARHAGDGAAAAAFAAPARAQAEYLRTMADDHGRLPGIGDEDGGQLFRFGDTPAADASTTLSALADALDDPALAVTLPSPETYWILGQAPRANAASPPPAWPSRLLGASGYFVSRTEGGHLVFDAGSHGFLNGGHAHADALSVVLSVAGHPLFVDPGTGTYTMDPAARDGFRAPAAHNTVTIEGRAYAEPAGPFRWRHAADARMLVALTGEDGDFAVGALDGYGFPVMRAVLTLPGIGWLIADHVAPPSAATIDTWWHLHPSWSAASVGAGFALTHTSGATLALATTDQARTIERGRFSPVYGRFDTAPVLRTTSRTVGASAMAAFVPAQARRGACPSIALAERAEADGWTRLTWVIGFDDHATAVTVPFPATRDTRPGRDWPRPCIQERRASCVE